MSISATLNRSSWSPDFELLTNAVDGSFLDFPMARHARHFLICGIEPDAVRTTFSKKLTPLLAQMPLQISELHD
jgi:hypothetical protein